MPPAIDHNMVLMMNAKEGQPAYWGEIWLVRCLGRRCCSESELWQKELFCIAKHSAAWQLFGDRISAPCPRHAAAPRSRAQERSPGCETGCVFDGNPTGKFGSVCL
jgi:hypothetical protein